MVVTTQDDLAVAAGPSVSPDRWLGAFDELMLRVGSRFRRVEPPNSPKSRGLAVDPGIYVAFSPS